MGRNGPVIKKTHYYLAKTQIPAKYKTFRMGRNGPVM
jgi:hypothetical protein